jgi:hypothetical protein
MAGSIGRLSSSRASYIAGLWLPCWRPRFLMWVGAFGLSSKRPREQMKTRGRCQGLVDIRIRLGRQVSVATAGDIHQLAIRREGEWSACVGSNLYVVASAVSFGTPGCVLWNGLQMVRFDMGDGGLPTLNATKQTSRGEDWRMRRETPSRHLGVDFNPSRCSQVAVNRVLCDEVEIEITTPVTTLSRGP